MTEGWVRFDLVDEPWLPVRMRDGAACEVGLRLALTRAHDIAGLDIEFPTQEPALLRLLLAVCYRALEGPRNEVAWDALWAEEALPEEPLVSYLDRWRDRFDLFHPSTPFFQTPGLEPVGKAGVKPASRLIAHAPPAHAPPVFTPITDAMSIVLHPAEAARWVVERHAWGTTSDKTGAKGNPKVKAGRDTPQIGHLGWIGFVAPIGRTLRETLLLNLVPWDRAGQVRVTPEDLPAWERSPTGPTREYRPPLGTCDLFSWQGRRIRLYPEVRDGQIVVAHVLVCAGDDVRQETVRTVDPHTGWHARKEKDGTLTYAPTKARVGQQVWRGLSGLLALEEGKNRAGVLSWLAAIEERVATQVSLLITAAEYGQMWTTMDDLVSDRLDTAISVLRSDTLEAGTLANDAASYAEKVAKALGSVADRPFLSYDGQHDRYAVPEGKKNQARGARDAIAEEFYGELDAPFRRYLVDLGTASYCLRARREWAELVDKIAYAIARRNIAQLSASDAIYGARAESWFRGSLARARAHFAPIEREEGVPA
jgi:CRISPR system Cascade subunit CasA